MSDRATIHGVAHAKPAFAVPAGATDCHVHVFGPGNTYPWAPSRVYTPGDASIADLERHQAALGLSRVVIVHPSPYGTDNACTIDAIARLGAKARGVAVIDPTTITDAELTALYAGGMRGARANLSTAGVVDPKAAWQTLSAIRDRVAPLGWHLQTFTNLTVIEALRDALHSLGVTLVVDHFGGAKAALGPSQPGFQALLSLVAAGRAYVKLSGAYRVSTAPDFADVAPLRPRADRSQSRPYAVGLGLAASGRRQSHRRAARRDRTVPRHRRRRRVEPPLRLDRRRCLHAQAYPGRQPGAALRLLTPATPICASTGITMAGTPDRGAVDPAGGSPKAVALLRTRRPTPGRPWAATSAIEDAPASCWSMRSGSWPATSSIVMCAVHVYSGY